MGAGDPTPETIADVEGVDCTDKTVVITGSTSGIGRSAALAFGRLGATVVVHGRDEAAGDEVVSAIEAAGGSGHFLAADFFDPSAVSTLANKIDEQVDQIDVLCNNAGGFFADTSPTDLGVDPAFHVNHLAHYQLTAALLDSLAPDARIVTTASLAHRGASGIVDEAFELPGVTPFGAYCRSKLANIQFTRELARRLAGRSGSKTATAFHPGIIPGSDFLRVFPSPLVTSLEFLERVPLLESVDDGAATMVYLGVSPAVEGTTRRYFARCSAVRPSAAARDDTAARELWTRSAELLEMDAPLPEDRE